MRETIGGTWITQLVIIFIFIFVAFLALSLNYSKAFRVKNETLNFIEKNEGFTNKTVEKINNYLTYTGYNTTDTCEIGSYGVAKLNNTAYEKVEKSGKDKEYYYCVEKVESPTTNFKYRAYYKVELFFKFNLPVIGDIFTFRINGQTKDVIYPADAKKTPTGSKKKNNVKKQGNVCNANSKVLNVSDYNIGVNKNRQLTIKLDSGNKAKIWYIEYQNMADVIVYNESKIKLKMVKKGETRICAKTIDNNCDCIKIKVK